MHPQISLLCVGDELLIGQVIDTNSAFMGRELNLHGMEVVRKLTVADKVADIKAGLSQLLAISDVVLMTGGLGPTKDDLTIEALGQYFGVHLVLHEPTWERMQRFFARLGRSTTPAHRRQCYLPANAEVLVNKMGTAPGMWMEQDGKIVVSMPGVPYEMKYLMQQEVIPRLEATLAVRPIEHRTLLTTGIGESQLAEMIADIEDQIPAHLSLAYLPRLGQVRLRLTARGADRTQLLTDLQYYGDLLRERLAEYVFGEGTISLSETVGKLLQAKGLILGTAESCTGGYLAHQITAVAGSSAYYHGSIIAYDNRIKEQQLGVKTKTLREHGAVSEACVREMVAGALDRLGVDIAVATSGIAGPTGGTPDKPVGTIWLAVGTRVRTETLLLHAGKDRLKNIEYTASRALGMLWRFLGSEKF
ncbi:MAG: competence/damage-inducible protein A [Bacteroidetes bacterium]|nr:MAG: competence/damage-inducible protein A [Bacteroidota bacterium]